ncbi:MAG: flagellar motor protein MotB [Candidatus Margulisbacteria bacterium]|nr:flagellar motor protein MotB [Candidatus Margulisiibacteriota bacterium]
MKAYKNKKVSIPVPVDPGAPRWSLMFGDLLSQILVFFVLLFSISNTNIVKYQQSIKSMQETLLSKTQLAKLAKNDIEKLMDIKKELDSNIKKSDYSSSISTDFDNNGIRIIINDSLFFDSGDSELLSSAVPALNTIINAINKSSYPVLVEGHTDNIPIVTDKYPSNWELSTGRACSVVKYFIDTGHLDPKRLVATGYADNRPVAQNISEENRAKNRRVEIKILEK